MKTPTDSPDIAQTIQNRLGGKNMIAIASGKGGIGKTWLAISLAHAFALQNQKVLLVDGDLGLSNIDIQLGLTTTGDLSDVFVNDSPLTSIIVHDENINVDVIAGHSGSQALASLPLDRMQLFCDDLMILAQHYDKVIVDLSSGIQKTVCTQAKTAGQVVILVNDEPTALADAYAFIKMVQEEKPTLSTKVVVNNANTIKEGERTFRTLFKACQTFLNIEPELLGVIHQDTYVREAIRTQTPILTLAPDCEASKDVVALANLLSKNDNA